jgi:hypothetical protein
VSSYPVVPRSAGSITDDGEVPGGGSLVVAVRLGDLASPLRNGRVPGEDARSALVIGGTERIRTGEVAVFCKVVAVARCPPPLRMAIGAGAGAVDGVVLV